MTTDTPTHKKVAGTQSILTELKKWIEPPTPIPVTITRVFEVVPRPAKKVLLSNLDQSILKVIGLVNNGANLARLDSQSNSSIPGTEVHTDHPKKLAQILELPYYYSGEGGFYVARKGNEQLVQDVRDLCEKYKRYKKCESKHAVAEMRKLMETFDDGIWYGYDCEICRKLFREGPNNIKKKFKEQFFVYLKDMGAARAAEIAVDQMGDMRFACGPECADTNRKGKSAMAALAKWYKAGGTELIKKEDWDSYLLTENVFGKYDFSPRQYPELAEHIVARLNEIGIGTKLIGVFD